MRKLLKYNKFFESTESQIVNTVDFPEIFNLDGFLTAIEDDGYKYNIKYRFKKDLRWSFNNNLYSDSLSTAFINNEKQKIYYAICISININEDDDLNYISKFVDNFKIDLPESEFHIDTSVDTAPKKYNLLIQYKEPIPILIWYREFYGDIKKSLVEHSLNIHNLKFDNFTNIRYELSSFYPVKNIDKIINLRYDLALLNLRKKWNLINDYHGRSMVTGGELYSLSLKISSDT